MVPGSGHRPRLGEKRGKGGGGAELGWAGLGRVYGSRFFIFFIYSLATFALEWRVFLSKTATGGGEGRGRVEGALLLCWKYRLATINSYCGTIYGRLDLVPLTAILFLFVLE